MPHPPTEELDRPGATLHGLGANADFGAPEFRILVFAPVGRTAELARQALGRAGFVCTVCAAMDEFCAAFRQGAGAALLVEEALSSAPAVRLLVDALTEQPV
ncbi:MAG TPA: hypothetical protein VEY93_05500, partial [Longimicrobium sp.]|nr:hypothetical protein [Longimicrobium sp.]